MAEFLAQAVVVCLAAEVWLVVVALVWWLQARLVGKRLAQEVPPTAEERRHHHELLWLTVVMNMTAVVAGALAGIGGSLFVEDGRVRWPRDGNAPNFVLFGVIAVEMVGIVGISWLTRPWHRWIEDAGSLNLRLRAVAQQSVPDDRELLLAQDRLRELYDRTLLCRRVRWLKHLGLVRPTAASEWRDPAGSTADAVANLRRQFHWPDLVRYSLVSHPGPGLLIAGVLGIVCVMVLAFKLDNPWRGVIVAAILLLIQAVLWTVTVVLAGERLVLENRRLARQRVWIAACRRQIAELRARKTQQSAPVLEPAYRVLLQVGRWALTRRA